MVIFKRTIYWLPRSNISVNNDYFENRMTVLMEEYSEN
jgi:hypothetical protein